MTTYSFSFYFTSQCHDTRKRNKSNAKKNTKKEFHFGVCMSVLCVCSMDDAIRTTSQFMTHYNYFQNTETISALCVWTADERNGPHYYAMCVCTTQTNCEFIRLCKIRRGSRDDRRKRKKEKERERVREQTSVRCWSIQTMFVDRLLFSLCSCAR